MKVDKILKVARSESQKFALVYSDGVYMIKYAVGTPREKYITQNVNDIKTWKTPIGVTKAWLKLLDEHNAKNVK